MRGVYSDDPTGTGVMLAFGMTDEACFAQLCTIGGDYDPSDDESLRYCDVTDALARTDGQSWSWLPGSGRSVACARAEADA